MYPELACSVSSVSDGCIFSRILRNRVSLIVVKKAQFVAREIGEDKVPHPKFTLWV
jgi:hypothetical protein